MTTAVDGAGAIIYYLDESMRKPTTYILIGQEGRYLSDLKTIRPSDSQNSKSDTMFFRNKAKELSRRFGIPVQYDAIKRKGDIYSVIWRTPMNSWGFPKGGREANETAIQTLTRELTEEVGLPITDKYTPKFLMNVEQSKDAKAYVYAFYTIEITKAYASVIIDVIKDKQENMSGEMFNLAFKPAEELMKYDRVYKNFNQKSLHAFRYFAKTRENIGVYYMSKRYGGKKKSLRKRRGAGLTDCISKSVYLKHKQNGGGYLLEPSTVIGGQPEVIAVHEPLLPKYSPEPIKAMETYVPSLLRGDGYGSPNPDSLQPFSPEAQYSPATFTKPTCSQTGGRRRSRRRRQRKYQRGGNLNSPYALAGLNSNFNADAMMRTYACSEPYWDPNCV